MESQLGAVACKERATCVRAHIGTFELVSSLANDSEFGVNKSVHYITNGFIEKREEDPAWEYHLPLGRDACSLWPQVFEGPSTTFSLPCVSSSFFSSFPRFYIRLEV